MKELPISGYFEPSELTNLTTEGERHLLQKLVGKSSKIAMNIAMMDIFAQLLGNEFFSLTGNETVNREVTATFQAVSKSLGKVQFQSRVISVVYNSFQTWFFGFILSTHHPDDQIDYIFYNLSSEIDNQLKNETIYTTLRDEYIKSESWRTRKIYLHSIPKSEEELRVAIAQLLNDQSAKKLLINAMYFQSEDKFVKGLMSYVGNFPGKSEAVQNIYDQMVLEVASNMTDISANQIDLKATINPVQLHAVKPSIIFSKLREKIATLIRP